MDNEKDIIDFTPILLEHDQEIPAGSRTSDNSETGID